MTGLSVRGLTVRLGEALVVQDVSFSAAAGSVTVILGDPGAGKTTLLACLAGLLPPERGAVLLDGIDVTKMAPRRRGIGFLPPGTVVPEARSTRAAMLRLAGRHGEQTVTAVLAALAPGFSEKQPGSLSHGEAFLALAVARLLPKQPVLLIDEVGQGLPPADMRWLTAYLKAQAEAGRTVVLATRDPALARLAHHLVLLDAGHLLQAGSPASLYAEPRTERTAQLTGDANILRGRVREVRAGGFVWVAPEGGRFEQIADPAFSRPALGTEINLCLRPERVALLAEGGAAYNRLEAVITDVRPAGPMLEVAALSSIGPLRVSVPSYHPPFMPAVGQSVFLGWAADAAWLLA